MAALKGNQHSKGKKNAQKLKTSSLKKMAYQQYCKWIAEGRSKKAWKFKHPDMSLTWQTMEKNILEDPCNFNPLHKQMAEADSLNVWEQRGLDMMLGKTDKCQPAIFQMFMRNKFGWDKETTGNKDPNETLIEKMAQLWRNL